VNIVLASDKIGLTICKGNNNRAKFTEELSQMFAMMAKWKSEVITV
jgi:hypothetical protein